MAERVLSVRELNWAVLARQLLLERSPLTPVRAVERVAGLQTQYAPSGYVGLWSRLASFRRADLTGALTSRRIVQAWVMRCTIHMVSAADYRPLTEAVRLPRRRLWAAPAGLDMADVVEAVRGHLAPGPLTQAELQKRLVADGFPREVWRGVQLWVDLVRVPPAGTWERPRAHVYGLADTWPLVFAVSMPQSVPTFLVDGQVAGTWRFADGRVRWAAFDELPARARAGVDAEAERLGELYAPGDASGDADVGP